MSKLADLITAKRSAMKAVAADVHGLHMEIERLTVLTVAEMDTLRSKSDTLATISNHRADCGIPFLSHSSSSQPLLP